MVNFYGNTTCPESCKIITIILSSLLQQPLLDFTFECVVLWHDYRLYSLAATNNRVYKPIDLSPRRWDSSSLSVETHSDSIFQHHCAVSLLRATGPREQNAAILSKPEQVWKGREDNYRLITRRWTLSGLLGAGALFGNDRPAPTDRGLWLMTESDRARFHKYRIPGFINIT